MNGAKIRHRNGEIGGFMAAWRRRKGMAAASIMAKHGERKSMAARKWQRRRVKA